MKPALSAFTETMLLFIPALLVLAWIGFVAYRDRRRGVRVQFGEIIELSMTVMAWVYFGLLGAFMVYRVATAAFGWVVKLI